MPTRSGTGTSVAFEVVRFLGSCDLRRFLRIEAHRDDIELIADIELDHLHGAGEAGEGFSAKHGAVVINEVEDQGFFAEVVAERHGAASVIDESEIRRNLAIEMLLNADV